MSNLTSNSVPAGQATVGGGAYIQPSPGVVVPGSTQYRDGQVTFQNGAKTTTPAAAAVLATVTPGVAGLYECWGSLAISGTTTVAADSNNCALNQTATAIISPIPFAVIGVVGGAGVVPFGPVVLKLSATDTVNVTAIALGTTSSVYAASVYARLVG